ncbi:MAG TPA: hypothetical protein VN697_08850 [Tepidiformaceae bacterium]|nr:hypothetical protein [Tepidiformaceae bacterium]
MRGNDELHMVVIDELQQFVDVSVAGAREIWDGGVESTPAGAEAGRPRFRLACYGPDSQPAPAKDAHAGQRLPVLCIEDEDIERSRPSGLALRKQSFPGTSAIYLMRSGGFRRPGLYNFSLLWQKSAPIVREAARWGVAKRDLE